MARNQILLGIMLIICFILMYYMESSSSISEIPERLEDVFKKITKWVNRQ
jgi:hypothetical protein